MMELMGFQGRSGPAAAALASLRQYGLVEGRDQSMRLTALAIRVLHPTDLTEKAAAVEEAFYKPDIYGEIRSQFSGKIPGAQVLKSYLIRTRGFNPNGADDFIKIFKENQQYLEQYVHVQRTADSDQTTASDPEDPVLRTGSEEDTVTRQASAKTETLKLRASANCTVTIQFDGDVTQTAIKKTMAYLELALDNYPE
jgi:hypothetical protein